ncbi:PREDICTED: uncharacterized protein LOC109168593 isoform X5 [Ipomoea nil]|uniref:uncharacterized protein LOC109168593 isoform X5 n=1 Tax=Ipomoea nil TaxID=35883 RepID=UPI000901369B|nr:PREDICTED: uncharacterized protein LOC109168593 isoform X5 [Ipomoea nil]
MGLQNFGLLCFHFLSWPMLALAYPLCASIRAIETGSKYHMRKLVTYWTVLSILSLFEHTLRVMKWVPFVALHKTELGAKLHCILSQFTRALYAQKQLLHNVSLFVFLNSADNERCCRVMQSIHIKAKEQTTEQGTEETKVKRAVDNLGEMQKQETEDPRVKGIPVAIAAEEKFIPEMISSSMLIQREWTCALCQVTTTSENDLKSHLRGKRHIANCEELKSSKRVTNRPEIFLLKSNRSPKSSKKNEPAKLSPAGGGLKQETNVKSGNYCPIYGGSCM